MLDCFTGLPQIGQATILRAPSPTKGEKVCSTQKERRGGGGGLSWYPVVDLQQLFAKLINWLRRMERVSSRLNQNPATRLSIPLYCSTMIIIEHVLYMQLLIGPFAATESVVISLLAIANARLDKNMRTDTLGSSLHIVPLRVCRLRPMWLENCLQHSSLRWRPLLSPNQAIYFFSPLNLPFASSKTSSFLHTANLIQSSAKCAFSSV